MKTHTLAVKSAAATSTSPAVFCDTEYDENLLFFQIFTKISLTQNKMKISFAFTF